MAKTKRKKKLEQAATTSGRALIPLERIERYIYAIRGERVMLDADLAEFYGVPTGVLNQAVKRNLERFPPDFRFILTRAERDEVITICDNLAQPNEILDELMNLPESPNKRRIGFASEEP